MAKIILAWGVLVAVFFWMLPTVIVQPGLWPLLIIALSVIGLIVAPLVGLGLHEIGAEVDE